MTTAPPGPASPSFAEIFREHVGLVWRALRGLGVGEHEIEDVCQEVFLAVHEGLARFRGESSLRTWIYGICLHKAAMHRRGERRRIEDLVDAPERLVPPHQHEDLQRKRAIERLYAILATLDDDKRAVFVLYEIEGLKMPEIAEAVGCPLQTAYARLYAARDHVDEAVYRANIERRLP